MCIQTGGGNRATRRVKLVTALALTFTAALVSDDPEALLSPPIDPKYGGRPTDRRSPPALPGLRLAATTRNGGSTALNARAVVCN